MVQHVSLKKKRDEKKTMTELDEGRERVCSMTLEERCKRRGCLQKVQGGSGFQCMSVFGVLQSERRLR